VEVDAEVEQVTVATAVCPITLRRGAIKSILVHKIAEVEVVEVVVEVVEVVVEVVEVAEVVEDLKRATLNQP
jgi:hypothetical protein